MKKYDQINFFKKNKHIIIENFYSCLKNSKALTVYIPLNNQGLKNGGLHVCPKSHNSSYEHFSSNTVKFSGGIKVSDITEKKLSYSLLNGDFYIHHCNIIHGAQNSSKSLGTSIAIRFSSINEKMDKKKKERYLKFLENSKRYSGV